MSPRSAVAPLVVAALASLTACDGGSATDAKGTPQPAGQCETVVSSMLTRTQAYVDQLEAPAPAASPSATLAPTPTPTSTAAPNADFSAAIEKATTELNRLGCDSGATVRQIDAGWPSLHAKGPVVAALLAQLRYSITDRVGKVPETRRLKPGDSLGDAMAQLAAGSTIVLAPGTYALNASLVTLRGITVRGAGPATTTVTSTASDYALLDLTSDPVKLSDLTLRHAGSAPASVITTGPLAALTLTRVHVTRGVAASGGRGGVGVLMGATTQPVGGQVPARTTTLTVRSSDVSDNAGGGVVVAGRHRADIGTTTLSSNGQCGICFTDSSDGWVRHSTLQDNVVGVAAAGTSRPQLVDNVMSGGQLGIQIYGSAAATIRDNTVSKVQRAAILFSGKSAGTVDGNTCPKDKPGIVVVGKGPYPYLKRNACLVATTK